MLRLRGPGFLVLSPDSSSWKAATDMARCRRSVVNSVCKSAIITLPRPTSFGRLVKVTRYSGMPVCGASPSGSRVTDSSRAASRILRLTSPVAPLLDSAPGVTRAATRPPASALGRNFSRASETLYGPPLPARSSSSPCPTGHRRLRDRPRAPGMRRIPACRHMQSLRLGIHEIAVGHRLLQLGQGPARGSASAHLLIAAR